jgi:peroxin-12
MKIEENGEKREINTREKNISLMFVVLIPYFKNRFDELYIENNQRNDSTQSTLTKYFQRIWPYFNAIYEVPFFGYILMYLFNKTDFVSPFFRFQKIILQRITIPDLILQNRNLLKSRFEFLKSLNDRGGIFHILSFVVKIGHTLSDYSRHLLLSLVFVYKFLEWWYATEDERNQNQSSSQPIIPPPRPPMKHKHGIELPKDCNLCPLCYKNRTNATQLSISGYVFCYKCINDYVNQFQKCPITFLPANSDNFRRIYDE